MNPVDRSLLAGVVGGSGDGPRPVQKPEAERPSVAKPPADNHQSLFVPPAQRRYYSLASTPNMLGD